jgi:hypothetical protein
MTAIRGQGRRTARSLKIAPIIALIHGDGEIETAIVSLGPRAGSRLALQSLHVLRRGLGNAVDRRLFISFGLVR